MWRQSLEASDAQAYLSLYADDFRHRGMDKEKWSSYRAGVFASREFESVSLGDILLIADPEEPGLFLSRFTQEFVTNGSTVRMTKRLYWLRRDDRTWQIVAEGCRIGN